MKRTFWCTEKHNTTHEHKDQMPFHLLNTVLVKLRKISTRLVTCTFCGTQFNPGEIPRLLRLLPSSRYYSHCLTHFLCSLCHSALPLMTLPDIKLALVHCGGREREMLSNLLNISHSLLTHTHTCTFVPSFTRFHPFDLRGRVEECRNASVHLCVLTILLIACTHFPFEFTRMSFFHFHWKNVCSLWPEPVRSSICMLLLVILNSLFCFRQSLPYYPSFSTSLSTYRFHDRPLSSDPSSFFFPCLSIQLSFLLFGSWSEGKTRHAGWFTFPGSLTGS